ncbi:hypothetical protein KFL_002460140 [Klebsormidium nitens]|uniref:Uncharacterized protein n=1 Tax=Klebsormidium nitens TaxID=105231 RepID=A0A1Y1IC25_KLENI|nr:hypothetical protein KFL_002460140 [Klebsormidium nitens]|eukprot:GAQ85638.1 hypothetical protein KFL_002460140 [Klebsormidium nitens]
MNPNYSDPVVPLHFTANQRVFSNGVTMGGCLSAMDIADWFVARWGPGAGTITPEELQKGASYVKADSSEEAFATEEQADMDMPEPSVVVPWVLNEVVTSTESDYFKGEGHFELQASRLLSCWRAYGDQFPSAFAAEVCLFMQKAKVGQQLYGTIRLVACFLIQTFTSKRAAIHIKNGSQELWPSFLHGLGQRLQSACQELAPTEASLMLERVIQLLQTMKSLTSDYAYMMLLGHDSYQHGSNVKQLVCSIGKLLRDTAGVEKELKREAAKATAKRAPWEKGGDAEQAGSGTLP